MAPKGWLPWVKARRGTSNERGRKCSSSSDVLIFEMLSMNAPRSAHHVGRGWDRQANGSVPRHVPPDLGEVGFAGAGLIDQLAVEHHEQAIRQLQQLVEVLAYQEHSGAAVSRRQDLGMDL